MLCVASRKTSSRPTYHHGDLARVLREEASKLVRDVGPENVSLRELARRIGVNHAAVYRHFEDKDAVLAAVAEDSWAELADAMAQALTTSKATTTEQRLVIIGAAYARYALGHPEQYRVMTGPRLNESGRFPSLEVPIQRAFGLLTHEFELARETRGGRYAEGTSIDWALRMWMFVHGYVTLVMGRRVMVKPARVEEYFERLLLPLLAHGS